VRSVVYRPVQPDHGHVVSVSLWRELEVRMDFDLRGSVSATWQRFDVGLKDVLAEGDSNL